MSEPTRTGRPRGFEEPRVVEQALGVFWERGFRGASVAELSRATGLLPGSLYGAFADKDGLFRAALARYMDAGASHVAATLQHASSPLEGLRAYLDSQIELACGIGEHHGCLMARTALERRPDDERAAAIVEANFAGLKALLTAAVRDAQSAGELSDRWPPDVAAAAVLALVEGFQVLGRSAPPEELRRAAALLLEALS